VNATRRTHGEGTGHDRIVLPNFLLIGAAKAGTTSLWGLLAQHPEVFLPETKEPNYFVFPEQPARCAGPAPEPVLHELLHKFSVTTWSQYVALFAGTTGEKAVGEASVRYLYFPEALARIRERLPHARMIAVLREPVSRLYSHYCMNRQFQLEDLELEAALAAEPQRIRAGWGFDWHYAGVSRYAAQIERWFEAFGRERVAVHLHDDLGADPAGVYRQVCRFLGVAESFVPDFRERAKEAYRPRHLALDRLLHHPNPVRSLGFRVLGPSRYESLRKRVRSWNSAPVPPLERALHRRLKELFRDDVQRLESLLGRDLSSWR
jgi:hypothetical protein